MSCDKEMDVRVKQALRDATNRSEYTPYREIPDDHLACRRIARMMADKILELRAQREAGWEKARRNEALMVVACVVGFMFGWWLK